MFTNEEKRRYCEGLILGDATWATSHGWDCPECTSERKCERWWEKDAEVWELIAERRVFTEGGEQRRGHCSPGSTASVSLLLCGAGGPRGDILRGRRGGLQRRRRRR